MLRDLNNVMLYQAKCLIKRRRRDLLVAVNNVLIWNKLRKSGPKQQAAPLGLLTYIYIAFFY